MKRLIYIIAGLAIVAVVYWSLFAPRATAQTASNTVSSEQYQHALDEQAARLKRSDDLLKSQEAMHQRAEILFAKQEQMITKQEVDLIKFEKILDTWEKQQKQYQKYLDSLAK